MNVRRHVLFACPIEFFLALVAFSMFAALADAIILFRTDDPTANTAEPTGVLAGSGWQYEGIVNVGEFVILYSINITGP